jgi:hypothetical protein
MIETTEEKKKHQLSFMPNLAGHINQLLDTIEFQSKPFKRASSLDTKAINIILTKIKKNSESVLLFRAQLNARKQKTQSQAQQLQIEMLEQKLSRAARLNAELYALIDVRGNAI